MASDAGGVEPDLTVDMRVVSYLAHELGSPVARIASAVDATLEDLRRIVPLVQSKDEVLGAHLNVAQRSLATRSEAALEEVRGILSSIGVLAQSLRAEVNVNFQPTDIGKLVDDVVHSTKRRVQTAAIFTDLSRSNRDFRFEVRVDESVGSLNADRSLVAAAIANLLDNAVKYSFPRRPSVPIVVSVHCRHMNSDRVAIVVRNWGLGIAEDDTDRIYAPFQRAGFDQHRAIRGMGLGLFIAQEIAHVHRGHLRHQSRPTFKDPVRVRNMEGFETEFEFILSTRLPPGSRTVWRGPTLDPSATVG